MANTHKIAAHQPPLVSVIIAAYNEGPLLAQAIESALGQTYPHREIIVVNDGSTDGRTAATAARYGKRIVYVERANGGVAAARNSGLAVARGELIALLDQDDRWLPHKLAVQVPLLLARPEIALVYSGYHLIDGDGGRTGLARPADGLVTPLPKLLIDVPIAPCSCLFPRRLLDEVGAFDPDLSGSDDWDLWLRLAARGYRFYCVGKPLAEYRLHAGNTSRNLDLMVRVGLGVLDKFYNLPNVPPAALAWRDRAYAHRHAWACAVYYGAGNRGLAHQHLRHAARYHAESVVTARFLQSLIHTGSGGPAPDAVRRARLFLRRGLAEAGVVSRLRRQAAARARLVQARYPQQGGRTAQVAGLVRVLLRHPGLLLDRELWAAGLRAVATSIRLRQP